MDSAVETLPNELLGPIVADLDAREIARLTQCSRRLRGRLELELYKDTDRVRRAAEWGSKTGNLHCLRAAMRHGGQFDVFKLSLAAAKGHDEAFGFMLDHGARIEVEPTDDRTLRHQIWKLMRSLSQPGNFGMMRRFFEAGLDGQAREAGLCPQAVWPLDRIISHGGPDVLERLQLLMDRGGVRLDANWPNNGSLISLAVEANLPDVVEFLIAHGADIHGNNGNNPRSLSRSRGWPCHIPVFAAAREMARSEHGVDMMRLVLQHGADINHRTRVLLWPRQNSYYAIDYYYTTPLLEFLDSVPSWKEGSGPDVVEGLNFLIGHGGTLWVPDLADYEGQAKDEGQEEGVLPFYRHIRPPTPIDQLLRRWGLQTLKMPQFLSVIKFLVKHGLRGAGFSPEEVANIIRKRGMPPIFETPAAAKGRMLLLDVLLEGRTAADSTRVLMWLLIKTGHVVETLRPGYSQAVDKLEAAGAHIDDIQRLQDSIISSDLVKSFVIRGRPPPR